MEYKVATSRFEAGNGKNYVLLIHGFPSIPYDVIPLAEFLAENGFHTIAPKLEAFGETKEILKQKADWTSWYSSISKEMQKIRLIPDSKIFISGISMGGNLTLYTAAKNPDIRAIAPICAPVKFPRFALKLTSLISKFASYFPQPYKNLVNDPQYQEDPILRQLNRNYDDKGVFKAVREELTLFSQTWKELPNICQPALICQSQLDQAVNPHNADIIFQRIQSKDKTIRRYPRSNHNLIYDYEKDALFNDILQFFQKYI